MFSDQFLNQRDDDMTELERKKIELIKLRIKNKYYDREDILEKVVQEIIRNEIKNN